jgi:serine/threonine protein phosphatase PrpC
MSRIEIRAASVRGLQHLAELLPRQDAFALEPAGGEELIAVVCDGVGTHARSDEAATLAARHLVELARDSGGSEWAPCFATVNHELQTLAWDREHRQTMATTALGLRVRFDGERWRGRVAWVGDSTLWHLSVDGEWSLCSPEVVRPAPLPAEKLNLAELELDLVDGALFLMSDGVGDPLAQVDDVRTTLAQWWSAPPEIHEFGRQVAFARESYEDDRTVVGLWARR